MIYEISIKNNNKEDNWKLSDNELQKFIWILYKLGYSVYRGFNDEIRFTVPDDEVTEIKDK